MKFDYHQILVFIHVVVFAYWLGGDLGVFICGRISRRPGTDKNVKQTARAIGRLIDMGPRTAGVLMVPVGLTLAVEFGSPIRGVALDFVWIASLVWLWMVWTIFWKGTEPIGRIIWQVDLLIRILLTLGFIGFGVWDWSFSGPISDRWLAAKFVVFGLILLDGIWLRLELRRQEKFAFAKSTTTPTPPNGPNYIICAVLLIWFLVGTAAFLGIAKPF